MSGVVFGNPKSEIEELSRIFISTLGAGVTRGSCKSLIINGIFYA
jgi:hypothetical protein